jgi:hypothetical protein
VDFTSVDSIARAVLYEGFLLYPYRTSALKNRQPCSFGSLYPRTYAQTTGDIEPWSMQIECLIRGDGSAGLQGAVRFLHPGKPHECEVGLPEIALGALVECPRRIDFSFNRLRSNPIAGIVEISAQPMAASFFKVRARIENHTPMGTVDDVMLSTHAIFGVRGGQFLSLIDPPDDARPFADVCMNRGAWPVLVGDRVRANLILAAPIILYDFPEVAPESPGNLFDGTEIDELLTLRIVTLSDAEKEAMRSNDVARALLERTETLASDQMFALHGAFREPPAELRNIGPGDRVLVRPQGNADVLDLALDGKLATIVSIEQDYEGRIYYTVALEDDPGHDLGVAGKPGHRFFFRRDELEWVGGET